MKMDMFYEDLFCKLFQNELTKSKYISIPTVSLQ